MGLLVIWRLRMFFVQPKVFGSESDRTAPRMRVDRIAMREKTLAILFRKSLARGIGTDKHDLVEIGRGRPSADLWL